MYSSLKLFLLFNNRISEPFESKIGFKQGHVLCSPLMKLFMNLFSTNFPLMEKPGSSFLPAKCLKNTSGRVTF